MPPPGSSHVRSVLLLILLSLLVPATALAAKERTIDKSRHLWATVNICDTKRHPDTLGVRASMPGSGRKRERMYMRFRAQYFSTADDRWHNFRSGKGTDSGWIDVGSARFKARQSGWSFPFRLEDGQRYRLRGKVHFEWRRGQRVVRSAVKRTTGGHGTAVSDPEGFSAATCRVAG